MPGVHLNLEGQKQADALARHLAQESIQQIFSSPLERAIETAEPLGKQLGLEIKISDALTEINFGDWTGKTLEQLAPVQKWQQWNVFRSGALIPNGELMIEVQARMVKQIQTLRTEFPDGRIALFSHGDPIRSALVYFLGMTLDYLPRIEISPASISVLTVNDFAAQVSRMNEITAAQVN